MHRVNISILKGMDEILARKGAGQSETETQQGKHHVMQLRVGHLEILVITWVPASRLESSTPPSLTPLTHIASFLQGELDSSSFHPQIAHAPFYHVHCNSGCRCHRFI